MSEIELPSWQELDTGAMQMAHLAYIEAKGPTGYDRTEAAVRGYLFGLASRKPFGSSGDLWIYPSLADLRTALARIEKEAGK